MNKREYLDRFMKVLDTLIGLERELSEVQAKIENIEEMGYTEAKPHWRREDMLELVHPSNSEYHKQTNRRREYVGTDPAKIREAKERVDRYAELKRLQGEATRIRRKIDNIDYAIKNIFRVCGQQEVLWGQKQADQVNQMSPNGDNGEWGQQNKLQPANMSPQAKSDVSPCGMSPRNMAEVRAYFEQSPILSDIAKDIPGG